MSNASKYLLFFVLPLLFWGTLIHAKPECDWRDVESSLRWDKLKKGLRGDQGRFVEVIKASYGCREDNSRCQKLFTALNQLTDAHCDLFLKNPASEECSQCSELLEKAKACAANLRPEDKDESRNIFMRILGVPIDPPEQSTMTSFSEGSMRRAGIQLSWYHHNSKSGITQDQAYLGLLVNELSSDEIKVPHKSVLISIVDQMLRENCMSFLYHDPEWQKPQCLTLLKELKKRVKRHQK